jgi:hypothetical protein
MSLPPAVAAYLSSEDGLQRAQLTADHPELQALLRDAGTRLAVLDWLHSDEAQRPESTPLVAGSIGFLRTAAQPDEAAALRPYTLHREAKVRLRAYEFLLTLYFPDRNPDALLLVLQSMLSDPDDGVRSQGGRYVERAGAAGELAPFLARWSREAPERDWNAGESAEVVNRLLAEREED